jgi:hypothetical protein
MGHPVGARRLTRGAGCRNLLEMLTVRSENFLIASLFLGTLVPTLTPVIFALVASLWLTYRDFVLVIGAIGNVHVRMTAWFFMGDDRKKAAQTT